MQKLSEVQVAARNARVLAACAELGAAAVEKVVGGDAASNQLNGVQLTTKEIQEQLVARITKQLAR